LSTDHARKIGQKVYDEEEEQAATTSGVPAPCAKDEIVDYFQVGVSMV
jgi:hypothetical protein